jgi:hypothetical protein
VAINDGGESMASDHVAPAGPSDTLRKLPGMNLREATADDLVKLKALSDEDQLRASNSINCFAIVEALRRHRGAIHSEEVAIKGLTWVPVVSTVVLVGLAIHEIWHR